MDHATSHNAVSRRGLLAFSNSFSYSFFTLCASIIVCACLPASYTSMTHWQARLVTCSVSPAHACLPRLTTYCPPLLSKNSQPAYTSYVGGILCKYSNQKEQRRLAVYCMSLFLHMPYPPSSPGCRQKPAQTVIRVGLKEARKAASTHLCALVPVNHFLATLV